MERNVNSRGCVWDHGCALECIHPLILCGEIVSAPKYKRTPGARVDLGIELNYTIAVECVNLS
jgi:hypothetical protein